LFREQITSETEENHIKRNRSKNKQNGSKNKRIKSKNKRNISGKKTQKERKIKLNCFFDEPRKKISTASHVTFCPTSQS
jgi:exopolysaccharide biosynthesis protein